MGFVLFNNLIVFNSYILNIYSGGVNGMVGDDILIVSNVGVFN